MSIESFKIETEFEADEYLDDLLSRPKFRSMDEVNIRARKYIIDERIRDYFIEQAERRLNG